ncbi:hypothetical protein AN960_23155 [Bacillus sp. FJAT-25509]|uniref:hypothetical protein n=1 Tax=Bacillus sp. FJAT-25509 TaxID=1712029 RepID=UPI0006FE7453|nr:hypothetical protein [Bacillus sp. FJAT-25509]KQL32870.1 hypothetical protein AN960_23155 [Bacillus sp. FJAT-25509]
MSKWLSVTVLFFILILTGCSANNGMKGKKPPKTMVQVENQTYDTRLGTYCWQSKGQGECVDTAGPVLLLEGKKPIEVKPGENVKIIMNFNPKPSEIHLTQFNNNKESEIVVVKNQFSAPMNKGVYYYSYAVYWMDKKDKHLSHGDAFYAFALEVK